MLEHYQNKACPEIADLMRDEAVTYSVLIKILQGTCTDIFTDHENAVVCYSAAPWPVWVWCRDTENAAIVTEIARCLKEQFPVEQGYDIILSDELREKLREVEPYFRGVKDGMGLLSYRLDAIEKIDYPCAGSMSLVREEEILPLVGVWQEMHREMEGRELTPERCETSIRRMVEEKCLFAWRNDAGEILALAGRGDQGEFSKITSVYTLPAHRRKGYAINLVHSVTEAMLAEGFTPILYTDAGYAASNACYQKIGYKLVGRLTSIRNLK